MIAQVEELNMMVANGTFFDANQGALENLFTALGRAHEWCGNPVDLLPYTQAKWVGQDHGNSTEKDQFTPEQAEAAFEIMDSMGLRAEILPPGGHYEQIVIIGGLMRVNLERIKFVKTLYDREIISADRTIFWAGQRLRDRREDGQLASIDYDRILHDGWIERELTLPDTPGPANRFANETELARLALLDSFESVILSDITARKEGVDSYVFDVDDYPKFVLMNCGAVERPLGPARHTTASCTQEWLEQHALSEDARVLLVAGNPHTVRNLREVRRAAGGKRPDISFDVCGPAANPEASLQLYLGEVGRMLHMDAKPLMPQV